MRRFWSLTHRQGSAVSFSTIRPCILTIHSLTRSDAFPVSAGRTFTDLPSVGPNLGGLGSLSKLRCLSLKHCDVDASHCSTVSLPSLTTLELVECGTDSAAAAVALATDACCPKLARLTVAGVRRTRLDGSPGPGLAPLALLACDSLTHLTLQQTAADYMLQRACEPPLLGKELFLFSCEIT